MSTRRLRRQLAGTTSGPEAEVERTANIGDRAGSPLCCARQATKRFVSRLPWEQSRRQLTCSLPRYLAVRAL